MRRLKLPPESDGDEGESLHAALPTAKAAARARTVRCFIQNPPGLGWSKPAGSRGRSVPTVRPVAVGRTGATRPSPFGGKLRKERVRVGLRSASSAGGAGTGLVVGRLEKVGRALPFVSVHGVARGLAARSTR